MTASPTTTGAEAGEMDLAQRIARVLYTHNAYIEALWQPDPEAPYEGAVKWSDKHALAIANGIISRVLPTPSSQHSGVEGEGKDEAGEPFGPGSREPGPTVPASGFDPSRWELSEETRAHLQEIDRAMTRPGDPRLNTVIGPGGTAPATDSTPAFAAAIPSRGVDGLSRSDPAPHAAAPHVPGPGYRVMKTGPQPAPARGLGPEAGYPAGGWRTISSAPRDGKPFLAVHEMSGVRAITWYGKTSHVPLYGWAHGEDVEDIDLWQPTHWMPLPAPPSALAGEAAQAAETQGGSVEDDHAALEGQRP